VQQFDLLENRNATTRSRYPLLMVLQHDRVAGFSSLVVAPLTEVTVALESTRLHPTVTFQGRRFVILIEELAAVHRRSLGEVVGNAESRRDAIVAALDLVFTGI
jgi:toxin CcdB